MPSPQLTGIYGRSQTDKALAEAMSIKDIENYHNFIPETFSPPALAGAPKRSPTASWVYRPDDCGAAAKARARWHQNRTCPLSRTVTMAR
jgi:hypothetical protein